MNILEHPVTFFLVLFCATLIAGAWLGCKYNQAKIRRLKEQLYFARLGL